MVISYFCSLKLHAFLILALLCVSGKSLAQEEFLGGQEKEAIRYFSAIDTGYQIVAFHDTVYPTMKEKIIVHNFKRWNTFGTLELYVTPNNIVQAFEITFPPKGSKTTLDEKNLTLALDELNKKYGKAFFANLAHGVSSYAWEIKDGELNFLVYTKEHNWSYGFYPDTGD